MFKPDWNALKAACLKKGYAFFERGRLNLNLIGVRHSDYASNGFDDVLCCAYMDPESVRHVEHWPATTDPGWHWLREEFMNSKGCAVLMPGQYRSAFAAGPHKGQYRCLVQVKPLKVWRDRNRDRTLDHANIDEGMFGIHIHKAGEASVQVDRWSAGCQVLARRADFLRMMELYDASAKLYGPRITYTLLTERDFG